MLNAITTLLVFQLVGEIASQVFRLPIPGPVVGMLLLFLTLLMRMPLARQLQGTAQDILQHLSLLFVPAGVGVMLHLRRVTDEWVALTFALVLSTVLTIAVTALSVKLIARLIQTPTEGS
ncbi:MAG: CidA/LrgA family protein [Acidiferrobacterales bacterium]|nr:CidA/LrgA family protein [Acidiferrobacterales bacterium]